jgi:hypothetical protein
MNEKKEGAKYLSLSKLINEYARSHSCISSLLETDRGVSKSVRRAYRRIQGKRTADYTTVWWRVTKVKVGGYRP